MSQEESSSASAERGTEGETVKEEADKEATHEEMSEPKKVSFISPIGPLY